MRFFRYNGLTFLGVGNMKILILTTKAGAGHNMAAYAIEEEFKNKYSGQVETEVMDMYNPRHRLLSFFNNEFYFWLLKCFPKTMQKEYHYIMRQAPNCHKNGSRQIALKAKKIVLDKIKQFQPDAIVSTHPYGVAVTSYLKEQGEIKCPIYAVVTDYALLPHWENAYNMDGIFTSCKEIHKQLETRNLDPNLFVPTGIPVFKKYEDGNRDLAKLDLLLDPQIFTILVMNGGTGLGRNKELLQRIESLKEPLQLIMVNGNNKESKRKVARYIVKHPNSNHKIYNLGHVDTIKEYMAVSDIYIGKAGGISTTEAIKMHLPIYVPFVPPYHEIHNIEYLESKGMAIYDPKMEHLASNIENFIVNPQKLTIIQQAMEASPYHDNAEHICDYIVNYKKK